MKPRTLRVEWSLKSVALSVLILIGFYLLYLLLPLLMLLFMGLLLAVTIQPFETKLAKRIGHKAAVATIAFLLIGGFVGVAVLIIPELIDQLTGLYNEFPHLSEVVSEKIPFLKRYLQHFPQKLQQIDASSVTPILSHVAVFGSVALGGLSSTILIFVFAIYLLLDGRRAFDWFKAFFNAGHRAKIEETCAGISPVISAYVVGQAVTSTLCALFVGILLSVLGVPGALLLAIIAGVFDVLPIIGFFLFTIPAALVALTVSANVALIVVVGFGVYHLIEAYLISPMVYGNRLRVSGFVVLSSLLVGGTVGGILGAIAILPIVASYPVIERVWLASVLGRRVVCRHEKIAEAEEGAG